MQIFVLALFCCPLLVSGWSLFGMNEGGDEKVSTPVELPFFGSLSSSSVGTVTVLDPFAALQVLCASKTFDVEWLWGVVPVLIVYGLIRGRAFCGWACPVNLLLEIVDALRRKLKLAVAEAPIPRHAKLWVALAVLVLSAVTSVPVYETFSPVSALQKGILFGSAAGLWTLAAIVLAELFFGHRVWCRSLCPLGAFYEVLGHVGQLNVRIDHEACIHCGSCKRACLCDPVILDPALTGTDVIVRAGDCMVCGKCIDACPVHALSYTIGRPRPQSADDEGVKA